MRDFIIDIFGDFSRIIVFLHIASSALLIGSMFVMRFIIPPVSEGLGDEKIRYTRYMKMVQRYMLYLVPVMLVIVVTSVFMHVGLGFKAGNPTTYVMVNTKEALWTFIAFNFAYMYMKYLKAKKGLEEQNFIEVEENIILMVRYFIPLNLVLALISVYFGVILRGF